MLVTSGNHVLWIRRWLSHRRIEWIEDLAESSQPAKKHMRFCHHKKGHVTSCDHETWRCTQQKWGFRREKWDMFQHDTGSCGPHRDFQAVHGGSNQWRHILRLQRRHSTWLMSRLAKFSEQKCREQWWKLVGCGENNRKHVPNISYDINFIQFPALRHWSLVIMKYEGVPLCATKVHGILIILFVSLTCQWQPWKKLVKQLLGLKRKSWKIYRNIMNLPAKHAVSWKNLEHSIQN